MRTVRLLLYTVFSLWISFTVGCGGNSSGPGGGSPNPVPSISSISPSQNTLGASSQTVTISGSNFLSSSSVSFNGASRTVNFVNSTQLQITLTGADVTTAGSFPIIVTNPSPGGGSSNSASFKVRTLTSIALTPLNPSVVLGETLQFTATGTLSDSSTQDVTSLVTWHAANSAATIDTSGRATSLALGRVVISSTFGSISASTTLINLSNPTSGQPRFAFATSSTIDGSVYTYTVDSATGQLRHAGYTFSGGLPEAIAVDPGGKFAYVANSLDNTVSGFSVDGTTGVLVPVPSSPFTTGTAPNSIAVDPAGAFVYVANSGTSDVSEFAIDRTTGKLTPISASRPPAGAGPSTILVDPTGHFVFVANPVANTISAFKVDAVSGAISASPGSPYTAGTDPYAIAVSPNGRFLYSGNGVSKDVSAFSIDASTGALTQLSGSPFSTGAGQEIAAINITPSGKFLYVSNFGSQSISAFSINADGTLSGVAGSPFHVISAPRSVQFDPASKFAYVPALSANEIEIFSISSTGALTLVGAARTGSQAMALALSAGTSAVTYTPKFAYVANLLSNNISAFSIDALTGALTSITGSPFASGARPFGIVVHPSSRFAYATNSSDNTVSAYRIDPGTGAMAVIAGSPYATGSNPAAPAIDPSGRFLFVPNYASNDVSVYAIDETTGALLNVSGSTLSSMYEPVAAAVDPTGRFLYIANQGGAAYGVCTPTLISPCGISAYSIDRATGVLTPVPNSPFPGGPEPSALAIDPSGRYLYVANQSTDTTFSFWIDPVSGSLTKVGATPPVSGAAAGITAEPLGRFLYTTEGLAWSMDSAGTLTQIPGPPFVTGSVPFSIASDVSGKFVYIADQSGGVYAYTIDDSSGLLQPITGSPFVAGSAPIGIATTGVHQ